MFNKENLWKIVSFTSLAIMGFVLIITSSIYLHPGVNGSGPEYDKAVTSVAFAVIGVATLMLAGYMISKNGFDKNVLFVLLIAFIFLLIAAAVPMHDQKIAYDGWKGAPSSWTSLVPASSANAFRIFPVALTFFLVPGVAFLGSSFMVAKQEAFF